MNILSASIYVHHLREVPLWARGASRFHGAGVTAAVC